MNTHKTVRLLLTLALYGLPMLLCAQGGGGYIPSGDQAYTAFGGLWTMLQEFAGVLLLIGCVIAGIIWMFGKPSLAIGVLAGSVVIFGGPFLIGLIKDGLGGGTFGQ